jgi:soluble lytic murein transglycosylase
LVLVVALHSMAASAKVPLPKPRPIARNVVPKSKPEITPATTTAARNSAPAETAQAATPARAPALTPATRQHAALPPPSARKPTVPAAVAATSSTSQSDKDALENVLELIRKRKPADATQVQATISDPVARKLAEWLILRSDNNGASMERYRAFLSANPSWPSQTFLRRRIEAALWDDRRDDATVWSWFENESPISAKGRFSLAKVLIARGDRANAERLVREAWRSDPMSEDTETTALDLFGAFLTAGDHKTRMDTLLYSTEQEAAGMRAAKRLGSGYVALAKARIAPRRGINLRSLLERCRVNARDTGYLSPGSSCFAVRKIRRAAQLMLSAPRTGAPAQSRRMVIERRLLGARCSTSASTDGLPDRAGRRASRPRHLQDRAGIHLGLDRAALPQGSLDRRSAFCPHRRRQRQPDRAGACRLLAGPRRGSGRPRTGGPCGLYAGGRAVHQLLWSTGARQTWTAADRPEWRPARTRRGAAGGRTRGAAAL